MLEEFSASVEYPAVGIYLPPNWKYSPNTATISTSTQERTFRDIAALTSNTGATYVVQLHWPAQTKLIALLDTWISEYGQDMSPTLFNELRELEENSVRFRTP